MNTYTWVRYHDDFLFLFLFLLFFFFFDCLDAHEMCVLVTALNICVGGLSPPDLPF